MRPPGIVPDALASLLALSSVYIDPMKQFVIKSLKEKTCQKKGLIIMLVLIKPNSEDQRTA